MWKYTFENTDASNVSTLFSLTENGYWKCEELTIFSFECSHFSFLKPEKQLKTNNFSSFVHPEYKFKENVNCIRKFKAILRPPIIHKIFETNASFHVK